MAGEMVDLSHDAVMRLLWMVAVAEVVVVLVLLAGVVTLHLGQSLQARRRNQFHAKWRPLLVQSLTGSPDSVPSVHRRDTLNFLYYWNYFHESLLGDDKIVGLNQLARLAGMDRAAARLMKTRNLRKQLMAIITLGHLGERSAWDDLVALAQANHPIVSLSAARALVDIDPQAALPLVMPWIGARSDWSAPKVAAILYRVGPDLIAQSLSDALLTAPPETALRLLHYVALTRCTAVLPAVRALLARESSRSAVRAACLNFIGACQDPKDVDLIRSFIAHPDDGIRAHAALALGTIGMPDDEAQLVALLCDDRWEVRYRAAEALAHLPFMRQERLAGIQARLNDARAKEILEPFIAAATYAS